MEKWALLLVVFICLIFNVGCIDKAFFPKAELAITSVDPYYVAWNAEGDGASATYSLPSVKIALQNYTGIPAELTSTSISYRTKLGELITQLPAYSRDQEITLEANSTTEFDVAFYYQDILDFTALTTSSIYPIKAIILLSIKDVNGNHQTIEGNCLIVSPDLKISTSAPTTTTTPTAPTTPTTPTATQTTPTPPIIPTTPATLEITSPTANRSFSLNSQVSFIGVAVPSSSVANISWSSSPTATFTQTSSLTTNATFSRTGAHTISLSATVSGERLTDTVTITITQ